MVDDIIFGGVQTDGHSQTGGVPGRNAQDLITVLDLTTRLASQALACLTLTSRITEGCAPLYSACSGIHVFCKCLSFATLKDQERFLFFSPAISYQHSKCTSSAGDATGCELLRCLILKCVCISLIWSRSLGEAEKLGYNIYWATAIQMAKPRSGSAGARKVRHQELRAATEVSGGSPVAPPFQVH